VNLSLRLHTQTKSKSMFDDFGTFSKKSNGLPDREIRKSDTIFRGFGLLDYHYCQTLVFNQYRIV